MKKIILNILALTVLASLSSCLKNKFDVINPKDSPSVIEFKMLTEPMPETPEGSLYTAYAVSYEATASVTATYLVQITGPDPAPQDITVNIGVKAGAVGVFNAEKQKVNPSYAGFTELPSSLYTIETPTAVIKSGQRSAEVKISYKTNDFDFSKKYALPISITSTNYATVSGNFGTIFLNVGAKNKWDGVYSYKSGPTQSLRPNANDASAELKTSGATTVTIPLVNYYTAPSNLLTYRIDPATNKVTVEGGGIGDITTDPSSSYDPATKVLRVKWNTSNRTFDETYTWIRSR